MNQPKGVVVAEAEPDFSVDLGVDLGVDFGVDFGVVCFFDGAKHVYSTI